MFIGKLGRQGVDWAQHSLLPTFGDDTPALPPPPPEADWYSMVPSWPMLANDRIGDCTIVGVFHAIQQWRTIIGNLGGWRPTDEAAIRLYSYLTGYKPNVPSSDTGAQEIKVLKAWTDGLDIGLGFTDRLGAFSTIDTTKPDQLRYAIHWFGNTYLGLLLPLSIEGPSENVEWITPPTALSGLGTKGSLGGHCALAVGYDTRWVYVVSWGALVRMSWEFWESYGDTAYVLLSSDFMNLSPNMQTNIDWKQLLGRWGQVQRQF